MYKAFFLLLAIRLEHGRQRLFSEVFDIGKLKAMINRLKELKKEREAQEYVTTLLRPFSFASSTTTRIWREKGPRLL